MSRKYFYIICGIAILCLGLIIASMWMEKPTVEPKEEPLPPPISPYPSSIAGIGIVEPASGNIFIGSPVSGIVERIFVTVGMNVKKGTPLLQFDDRELQANLTIQQFAYDNALARLHKLEAEPRSEDVSAALAVLKSSEIQVAQAKSQYEMVQGLQDTRALSQEEINRRRFNYEESLAKLQQAKADYDKIKAGAWKPDLEIARLEALQAKANVERVNTDIERTIIRSPIDGTVLQIKIHEGEYPPPDSFRTPMMIVGNIEHLHLRVSINQLDVSFFQPKATAKAFLQGNANIQFPLEFVRIEPYLVNKENLTNDIMEQVDTRVLQVIYRFKTVDEHIYVGEQMDVFIDANDPDAVVPTKKIDRTQKEVNESQPKQESSEKDGAIQDLEKLTGRTHPEESPYA